LRRYSINELISLLKELQIDKYYPISNSRKVIQYLTLKPRNNISYAAYLIDDRKDYYEINEPIIKEYTKSVAILLNENKIIDLGNGKSQILTNKFNSIELNNESIPLCSNERFYDQPQVPRPNCTGFLVASNLLATVGHAVKENVTELGNLEGIRIVFGYNLMSKQESKIIIDNENIFGIDEIVAQEYSVTRSDWAIIKMDRIASHRRILPVNPNPVKRLQRLYIIGHPLGLPIKYAKNAQVRFNDSEWYFKANLDAFAGNSGSPVFNEEHQIVGILARGSADFEIGENCANTLICPNIGHSRDCGGEHCIRASEFLQYIS
jgi:V8-like Glu-specific endopeptidase